MRITDYELFEVPPRWLFLKLTTADGTVGWGEPTLEGNTRPVRGAVESLMENYLLGRSANDIERHWKAMYRGSYYRGGPVNMTAIAGIDQALWDLKGKQYGAPVYELLGGKARDRVYVYQWIGGETPEEVAASARAAVDAGYRTVKLSPIQQTNHIGTPASVTAAERQVEAVREAVGDDVNIAVDFRGRVDTGTAKRLSRAIEPYRPMFIEEPVVAEHIEQLVRVDEHTETPIATGGRLYSRWEFKGLLDQGSVDIVQPNPSHVGGLSEAKRIADLAETYGVVVMPNCAIGPIALAACVQLDVAVDPAFLQVQNLDVHEPKGNDLLAYLDDPDAFGFENGYVKPPDGPGLGVDIVEDAVREAAERAVEWQNPRWYNEDGSVSEW
ncbi:MAG: galactonate dehydratase [Haloplanus sp.]